MIRMVMHIDCIEPVYKDKTMAMLEIPGSCGQEEMIIDLLDSRRGRHGLVHNMKEKGHDENTIGERYTERKRRPCTE